MSYHSIAECFVPWCNSTRSAGKRALNGNFLSSTRSDSSYHMSPESSGSGADIHVMGSLRDPSPEMAALCLFEVQAPWPVGARHLPPQSNWPRGTNPASRRVLMSLSASQHAQEATAPSTCSLHYLCASARTMGLRLARVQSG